MKSKFMDKVQQFEIQHHNSNLIDLEDETNEEIEESQDLKDDLSYRSQVAKFSFDDISNYNKIKFEKSLID